MFALLSLLALAMLQIESSLQSFTTELAANLQNTCAFLSPIEFQNREWISAVVCGKNPAQNSEYRLLQMSGLLHLVVVSGSHLVFVEQFVSIILDRLKFRLPLKALLLAAFALMTGFQAPVVRALCSQLLNHFQTSAKLFWSPPATTLFAGLFTLIIAPAWWKSISLQLSWVAALSLQVPTSGELFSRRIKQQLWIFILMLPLLVQFAPPHPVSIAYNLIAAPFVGLIMFPASAAAMALPQPLAVVDQMWSLFFKLLDFTLPIESLLAPVKFGSVPLSWIYIFSINLFFIHQRARR